jgi:hypothetical protein
LGSRVGIDGLDETRASRVILPAGAKDASLIYLPSVDSFPEHVSGVKLLGARVAPLGRGGSRQTAPCK